MPADESGAGVIVIELSDEKNDDRAENRGLWHNINYPFKPGTEPDSVKTSPPDNDNIEKAFEYNLGILKDSGKSGADRAKALCWIFHLAGDAHQPLHPVSLFSSIFNTAEGDGAEHGFLCG
jgi:S1/P1 Nuclease